MEHRVITIESGYARVANATGHTLGHVYHDKLAGSTRSGQWVAQSPGKRKVGSGVTREQAVAALIAWQEARQS